MPHDCCATVSVQLCEDEYWISPYTTNNPAASQASRAPVAAGQCQDHPSSFGRSRTSGTHEMSSRGHNAYWNLPPKFVSLEMSAKAAANSSSGIRKATVSLRVFRDRKPSTNASRNGPANRVRLPSDSQNESQCSNPPPFL